MPVFNSQLWISLQLQNLIHPDYSPLSSPTSLTSFQFSPRIPLHYAWSWPVLPPCLHLTAPAHDPPILPCFISHPCPTPCLHLPPSRVHPIPSHHQDELGALGRPESACAYTRTASAACGHHRDSETWNRWAQQVTDWQPTRATGTLRTHCATKLKIPIRLWGFLFDFMCLFVFKSRPEDCQVIQSEKLSNTAAVRLHSVIATFLFPLTALD